jgi:serine/threonine protein kinase
LTQTQYIHLVEDITEQLRELNKAELQHNNVKPENIIYSNKSKRFLLVGWEYAREISSVPIKIKHIGNKVFNHPLKYYLSGFPRILSLKFISFGLMSSKYKWIKQLPIYLAFKSFMDSSFDFIMSKYGHLSSKELHKRFSKHFDLFSFGMVVLFYGAKYKLEVPTKAIDNMFKEFTPSYLE